MSILQVHARINAARDAAAPTELPDTTARRRAQRVTVLLLAIILMSVGDLYMTLTHVTQAGMLEANPIARRIMAYNSPALLSAWKLASVGIAVAILFWARHRGRTEIATWFCLLVLTWLTCRWCVYSDQVSAFAAFPALSGDPYHAEWVAMTPGD